MRNGFGQAHDVAQRRNRTIDPIRIGSYYDTTSGTLWKDGTYYPQGTRVLVTGLHLDQGYCVRFPVEDGAVERGGTLPASVLSEAREVLDDAEDGCHLHLHESDDN